MEEWLVLGNAFSSGDSTTTPSKRQSQRELDGPTFAWPDAYVGKLVRWVWKVIGRAWRFGVDDQIDAGSKTVRGNLTCSEFENATRAARRNSNAPWPDVLGERKNAHLPVQKHHVDGKAHAQRVDAAAWNHQQSLFFAHGAATQQPDAAGLKRTRHVHVACDTAPRRGT